MIAIKVPPLGESIVEATIARWTKQPGEAVVAGETLVELETDKVTVEVPALKAGVLAAQAKHEGDTVKVDETLGEIDDRAAPAVSPTAPTVPAVPAASTSARAVGAAPAVTPSAPPAAASAPAAASSVRASPAAQRLAEVEQVDLAAVAGSGRGGVVSKADVIDHVKRGRQDTPPAAARETRERMSTRRRRIADNLLQSQLQTAHLTTFNEIDMSAVVAVRDRLRPRVEKEEGVRLTFMPFFVRAACLALEKYPLLNAQIEGDAIVYHHYVNMGIAVASDQGLVVPVLHDADRKGMLELSREMATVAQRAREGKLSLDDLTGGTFTITNGGVFGSLVSTPILNYPQVGILGLHKIQDRPVVLDGQIVARPMMYVALSYDHRLVDGQQAVVFLVRIKELMEDPAAMLVA